MKRMFNDNPSYLKCEVLLKNLHLFVTEGKNDSEEADQVREEMDDLERDLNSAEMERLNGLSADLYMLQDDEIYEPGGMVGITPEQLNAQIRAAWENKDWDGMLRLLRKGPGLLSKDQVASLRAEAYGALGHLDTSVLFSNYAIRQNSNGHGNKPMSVRELVEI